MAHVYVYSGAAGAGTGADWANAYTTLVAAFAAKAAGDDFWVAHDHAETQASAMVLTPPGTAASPNRVICVNRAGSVPPVSADLATTATITTTGANSLTIGSAYAYCRGVTFSGGSGATTVGIAYSISVGTWILDQCKLSAPGTTANIAKIGLGGLATALAQKLVLIGTTLQFGNVGDGIALKNIEFVWRNTTVAIAGSTFPTSLFKASANIPNTAFIEAVDFAALGSATLVNAISCASKFIFKHCKLGSGAVVAVTPTTPGGAETILIRCDSGDTNYRTEKYSYTGTQTTETTIVRTGGASDGTTPISWKIITTANSERYLPFESLPISIWNETVGSAITLTVEGIWGGGAVPTNANIWMDVEYLGTSGFPLGLFATNGPADQLAAGTNLTSSSETWGGSTTKFKMSATITPQEKGPITVYVNAALASSTFYIDPKIAVS